MFQSLKYGNELKPLVAEVEQLIKPIHEKIEERIDYNQFRVLDSYQNHKVSDSHFIPSTGYGYDDYGRDTLDKIFAEVFGGEAGLVRTQMISGTHAIATALYGVLRPGDELLYITGKPYDTLEEIIGITRQWNGFVKRI